MRLLDRKQNNLIDNYYDICVFCKYKNATKETCGIEYYWHFLH